VDRNLVFFGSTDGKLYSVNTQTGKVKWEFEVGKPIVASPIVHDGVVYFGGANIFYAVDAKSGKKTVGFRDSESYHRNALHCEQPDYFRVTGSYPVCNSAGRVLIYENGYINEFSASAFRQTRYRRPPE
jgi:outer membrane protein assembly factor BamB